MCAGCISSREKEIGTEKTIYYTGHENAILNVWGYIASFAARVRFDSRRTSKFDDRCMPSVVRGQCPTLSAAATRTNILAIHFVAMFLLRNFRFSLVFLSLVCFVHSTKLCRARCQCRRRRHHHRRPHRIQYIFSVQLQLHSDSAGGFAGAAIATLFFPRLLRVPRNYDIVGSRVCACCRRWLRFFRFCFISFVDCENVPFARETDFLRFSAISVFSFGFGSTP